jgi:phage N-6-adenine-methyltransferase
MSRQDYRTPRWFFDAIQDYVRMITGARFVIDAAAEPRNAMCACYYTKDESGLDHPWSAPTFVNPPFRRFGDWIRKAYIEASLRAVPVAVVGPTGCSQRWFHEEARRATILVPDRRVSFLMSDGTPTRGADRDTMVYLFGPGLWATAAASGWTMVPFKVGGLGDNV